jgi:hypothetical protein
MGQQPPQRDRDQARLPRSAEERETGRSLLVPAEANLRRAARSYVGSSTLQAEVKAPPRPPAADVTGKSRSTGRLTKP